MECKNCKWSSLFNAFNTLECRRHAPSYKPLREGHSLNYTNHQFALVKEEDWCGDYCRKETK